MCQLVWYYSNPTPCRRKFTIIALAGSYQLPHTAVAATPKTYKCTNFTITPFSNQNYKKPNFQISPSRQCICKKGLLTTQLMYFSCQMVFVSLFCSLRDCFGFSVSLGAQGNQSYILFLGIGICVLHSLKNDTLLYVMNIV